MVFLSIPPKNPTKLGALATKMSAVQTQPSDLAQAVAILRYHLASTDNGEGPSKKQSLGIKKVKKPWRSYAIDVQAGPIFSCFCWLHLLIFDIGIKDTKNLRTSVWRYLTSTGSVSSTRQVVKKPATKSKKVSKNVKKATKILGFFGLVLVDPYENWTFVHGMEEQPCKVDRSYHTR